MRKATNELALTYLFNKYRRSARTRGIVFLLTRADMARLVSSPCVYCGREKTSVLTHHAKAWRTPDQVFHYSGVDRVDNTRGYEADNAVSCCWMCNRAKQSASVEEWDAWRRAVALQYLSEKHRNFILEGE